MARVKSKTFKDIPGLTAMSAYSSSYHIYRKQVRVAIFSKQQSTAWIYKSKKLGINQKHKQKFNNLHQAMRWVYLMTQHITKQKSTS